MMQFTDAERERIRQAVQQAERGTKGEIVPMIVPASALYREASYRTGLMLALLALALLLTIEIYWLPWGWHAGNAGWLLLAVRCGLWTRAMAWQGSDGHPPRHVTRAYGA